MSQARSRGVIALEHEDSKIVASIIVCTYNRAWLLGKCLESILADSSTSARELIVVDNASTDATAAVVAEVSRDARIPIRPVREDRLGQSHARNAAVAAARGELLLFTDDDVVVDDGWADALVAGFDDPGVGAVGGRILPCWPFPPPKWLEGELARSLGLPDLGEESRVFKASEIPIGANMAIRADVARSVGPFDPQLGHRGSRTMGHDEWLFLEQVRKRYVLTYRADARVFHLVHPERMDLGWLRSSFFRGGIGLERSERRLGSFQRVSLPRRVVRAAKTCRGALAWRLRNRRTKPLGPEEAFQECYAYKWAGKHLEALFGRFPTLTDWMAQNLVRPPKTPRSGP
jgi:glycosyltransferase involved in cell wall biosynthesis